MATQLRDAVICESLRTPVGRMGPDDLAPAGAAFSLKLSIGFRTRPKPNANANSLGQTSHDLLRTLAALGPAVTGPERRP
jgi:hypothetical protein